jgi:adenosine deaminase
LSDYTHLPKLELHLHLEGAAQPEFIRQLAHEKKVDLKGVFNAAGDYDYPDFLGFLKVYEAACQVLTGPQEFYRLVEDVLKNSASHGVIYTEFFVSPDFCGGGDLSAWREYLAAMDEAAGAAAKALGIETRFIVTPVRHMGPDQAKITAKVAQETAGGRLTGFGMGGDENFGTPADFTFAFDMAREAGLRITQHAGEMAGPTSIIQSLDHLKPERIGHGVRAIEDPKLVDRLAAEQITLEVNPGSNVALGIYPDWQKHPIVALRDAGVLVTVSTDDPPFFHTDMTNEYTHLADDCGWGTAEFLEINLNAAKAAFCDKETTEKLIQKLEAAYV